MMEEVLTTTVVVLEEEVELQVIYSYNNDVLVFRLDGKEIFSADWSGNLMRLFIRALQLWFSWDALKQ